MKVIVGLGNPGKKYEYNRHNVGFMFVDYLSKNWKKNKKLESEICETQLKQGKTLLVKPQTFMNASGVSVKKVMAYYHLQLDDLIIVHDDLDLRLGEYKKQFAKGPKIHNGILSVERELKTKAFWRLRIGVDNRERENRVNGQKYVLEDFNNKELLIIKKVFEKICYSVGTFL